MRKILAVLCSALLLIPLLPISNAQVVSTSQFITHYEQAGSAELQVWSGPFIKNRPFDPIAELLTEVFELPRDVHLVTVECGPEIGANAFYNPSKTAVILCYELANAMLQVFDPSLGEDAVEATLNAFLFVLYHEIGHALIDVYDLDVLGGEEDAVDTFATLLLIWQESDLAVVDSAIWWGLTATEPTETAFADEHSLNQQRFYNILCLLYGSNPDENQDLITDGLLPEPRAARCPSEYSQAAKSWDSQLSPFVREEVREPIEITFDKGEYTLLRDRVAVITVVAPNANTMERAKDAIDVYIWSTSDPTGLVVKFSETGLNTGIFSKEVKLKTIKLTAGDTITAEYIGSYGSIYYNSVTIVFGDTKEPEDTADKIAELNEKGNELFDQGRYGEALVYYDRALAIDPNDVDVLYNKANTLDALGRYEEALLYYDKALAIEPNAADVLYNKAYTLGNLDRDEEAIVYLDRVLAINPNDIDALFNKAVALFNLERYEEAIEYYDKVLAIDPNDVDAINNRQEAYDILEAQEPDEPTPPLPPDGDVSVAMKHKKKLTLISIKNNGDEGIFGVQLKIEDGKIRYVKARGWDRDRVDQSTVIVRTDDRPIKPGKSLIMMLIVDNRASSFEWKAFDISDNLMAEGDAGAKQEETIFPGFKKEKPLLRYEWKAYGKDNNEIEVTIYNDGTGAAKNVQVWAGFDAGNDKAWSGKEFGPFTLQPNSWKKVTLSLDPPPNDKRTRVLIHVWADNVKMIKSESEWFDTLSKPTTTVEEGEIKWKFSDSQRNRYSWSMPIETYENTIKRPEPVEYLNLKIPSTGETVRVRDHTKFVEAHFTKVIDQIYDNAGSDEQFVYEVWYIVASLTTYSRDIEENPRWALETFSRGGGDCEDTTILIADMLRSSEHTSNWVMQMVYFDFDNPGDPQEINHVALWVNTGTDKWIVESTAKTDEGLNVWTGVDIYGYWYDV